MGGSGDAAESVVIEEVRSFIYLIILLLYDRFTVINYKPLTTIEDYTSFLQQSIQKFGLKNAFRRSTGSDICMSLR